MKEYFVDLHIHIGRTNSGKPVKITGSRSLTIENILIEASEHKGIDMIGVIDCHVPEVLMELEMLMEKGKVYEKPSGGLQFSNATLLLGSEIEIYDEASKGPFHVLIYLPTINQMKEFSIWLSKRMKNVTLSTQRLYETARNLQDYVKKQGGLFIPAHVFTPFKSVYGTGVRQSLQEVFNPNQIDAIELGLSSNTEMADQLQELHNYTFVSNSDAHSLAKIGREYQLVAMEETSFIELERALHDKKRRKIIANYGLDPQLGKYHVTTCEKCIHPYNGIGNCPACGHHRSVKGVFNRLLELKNSEGNRKERPPYIHQVPLEFIPKLGPKTMEGLKHHFGTEMNILHYVPIEELKRVVNPSIAEQIEKARLGRLNYQVGGGGKYGKVTSS